MRTQSACSMSPVRNLRVSAAQITVVTDLIALRWIAVLSRSVILMQTACMTHLNYGTSVCVEMVSQVSLLPWQQKATETKADIACPLFY